MFTNSVHDGGGRESEGLIYLTIFYMSHVTQSGWLEPSTDPFALGISFLERGLYAVLPEMQQHRSYPSPPLTPSII